jgi:LDH2 family malate/lactate/ureidoglycolate dehydrogenase
VQPLYGDTAKPYNCSHTFIAIDASRVNGGRGVAAEVTSLAEVIRQSKRAPGVDTIFAPGDLERAKRSQHGDHVSLAQDLIDKLHQEAERAGLRLTLSSHPSPLKKP